MKLNMVSQMFLELLLGNLSGTTLVVFVQGSKLLINLASHNLLELLHFPLLIFMDSALFLFSSLCSVCMLKFDSPPAHSGTFICLRLGSSDLVLGKILPVAPPILDFRELL
jgi:hypothetical protein